MPSESGFSSCSRRHFLATLARTAGVLTSGLASSLPAQVHALVEPAAVTEVSHGLRGVTLRLTMAHGPFPCRSEPYTDATTWVFVPTTYRLPSDQRVDLVVHFHGHNTTAQESMERHQLREQLFDSRQNAILVMPQGPVQAADSSGGKLDQPEGFLDFLTEVRKTLQLTRVGRELGDSRLTRGARVGVVCASAHSGGYRVLARCASVGGFNINEVFLFDALYGEVETFFTWVAERADRHHSRERHKLCSFFSDDQVQRNNHRLMRLLEEAGISYTLEERGSTISRGSFTRSRCVFFDTRLSHGSTTHRENNLRDCLYASCLHRTLETDWFDDTESPRTIEIRE
ncbi:MAG: hypothetical protein JW797_13775 [Bradymonadales bacterium]|nr:hypothetical protein [Bradymonadales bacterium]